MKLTEISNKLESEVANIINRPIPMSLLGPENCLVTILPKSINIPSLSSLENHQLFTSMMFTHRKEEVRLYLQVDLFLDTLELRKEVFEEILQGTQFITYRTEDYLT